MGPLGGAAAGEPFSPPSSLAISVHSNTSFFSNIRNGTISDNYIAQLKPNPCITVAVTKKDGFTVFGGTTVCDGGHILCGHTLTTRWLHVIERDLCFTHSQNLKHHCGLSFICLFAYYSCLRPSLKSLSVKAGANFCDLASVQL